MSKKDKEDERTERLIRSLLKLPENRRCINCNSLGPQYVCTTFMTFICTNCCGTHREFSHRVKSVSMSKFTAEEVSALQAGGNEKARQIYLKGWDPLRNSYPDSSDLAKIREFIKHVYVDKRYFIEISQDKLPRLRLSDRQLSYEGGKAGVYRGEYTSPTYQDRHQHGERSVLGRRYGDKSIKHFDDKRTSPPFAQENSRHGGFKKTPVRFEVVDDRFRDDATTRGRKSDSIRFSHRDSKFRSASPNPQKDAGQSTSWVRHSVKHIIGENVPPFQMVTSSGSVADENLPAHKSQNLESMIDFDNHSEPSGMAEVSQTQESQLSICSAKNTPSTPQPNTLDFLLFDLSAPSVLPEGNVSEEPSYGNPPSTSFGGNMLMNDSVSAAVPTVQNNMPTGGFLSAGAVRQMSLPTDAIASINVSESNLHEDSFSPAAPVKHTTIRANNVGDSTISSGDILQSHTSQTAPGGRSVTLFNAFDGHTTPSTATLASQSSDGGHPKAALDTSNDSILNGPNDQQASSMQQHQPFVFSTVDGSTTGQPTSAKAGGTRNNQTSTNVNNAHGSLAADDPSQDVSKPSRNPNSGVISHPLTVEMKSCGGKDLPQDFFAASYTPAPSPIPGWPISQPYGPGFDTQYFPNTMPSAAYPKSGQSTNPFDLTNETTLETMPNVSAPKPLLHTSSIGSNSPEAMTTQSPSYASFVLPGSPSYASAMSSGAYMGQQEHMNMPPFSSRQAVSLGGNGGLFGPLSMPQQLTGGYTLPTLPTTPKYLLEKGGNPFG